MIEAGRHGRERLAWIVLFGSFFACLLFSVSVPLAVNAFVQNATRPLEASILANQGTVGIDSPNGQRRAVLTGEPPQTVDSQVTILTDSTASALVTMQPSDAAETLATMQIASNSTVNLNEATAPRFRLSGQTYQMAMELQSGRIRLDVPFGQERPLQINLQTPQSQVAINEPGRYTVDVTNDATQVTVQERGIVAINANDEQLLLLPGQRAEVATGGVPVGPLNPARNLVRNGDFGDGLDNWALFAWQVELPDEPKGTTDVVSNAGNPTLRFARQGIGHADVRVTQSINADVSDLGDLRLLLTLNIIEHSLGVCGVQGSECPLFVIVNYIDESGVSRVWQHGFFADGTVDDNLTPGACVSCAVVQTAHERVPAGQLFFYEVNLNDELARQGFLPPRYIESISLVGSGHSFISEVADVALIIE
jgi:hypothetical protein